MTGGASGIGRELCRVLTKLGWRVAVADRDAAAAERLAEPLRAAEYDAVAIELDVTLADHWRRTAAWLVDHWGGLDVLVNNAGVLQAGPLIESTEAELRRVVDTNLTGALLGCHACGPVLVGSAARDRPPAGAPRSGVVNVASIFGPLAPPGFAAYAASKAGLVALSESLRGELAPRGLNVTAALPGVVPTAIYNTASFTTPAAEQACRRRVDSAELTAEQTAAAILRAAHTGEAAVTIGGRARRFAMLKRLLPVVARRAIERRAVAELGLSPG